MRVPDTFNPDGVAIPEKDLETARGKLRNLRDRALPWEQLFIGLATPLLFGAPITAATANIKLEQAWEPIIFYIVCPVLGAVFLTSFVASKIASTINSKRTAEETLSILPDPKEV